MAQEKWFIELGWVTDSDIGCKIESVRSLGGANQASTHVLNLANHTSITPLIFLPSLGMSLHACH